MKFSANSMPAAETSVVPADPRHAGATGAMRRSPLRGTLLVLALSCFAVAAQAREISAQEAAQVAAREADGKVLSVQTLTVGKRKIYRVKVLTRDGRVRVVQVAAQQ